MVSPTEPTELARLAEMLAGWRDIFCGRELFRAVAGRDWLRLQLADEERTSLLLSLLPGRPLLFSHRGRLPDPVHRALAPLKDHPLPRLLNGARLDACGALPGDRVACFRLVDTAGRPLYLFQQLFGSSGNIVLIDDAAVLLWARRRPPHRSLTAVPPDATWHHQGHPGDITGTVGLHALTTALIARYETELRTRLMRRRRTLERLCENLGRDLENAEQGDHYRRQAEALAANLHLVGPGADRIVVTDPRDGGSLEISLDPALSPAANLEAWFRRARKADRGRDIIAGRLADAEKEAETLRREYEYIPDVDQESAGLEAQLATLAEWQSRCENLPDTTVTRRRVPGRAGSAEEPARSFRRYRIDGRWDVWIGRSNQENDELTHRASHSRDIWLHAQGVPGSHVILRTAGHPEQVPRAILAKAAALAALHSKARHSGLVPVIHTERRYVRKPRKAAAGTAVTLRDKSIFVEPGVLPGVEPA